ncbi:MAG TPA: hypothetical protein VGB03_09105, partial [Acidimicrobiales bacterium]
MKRLAQLGGLLGVGAWVVLSWTGGAGAAGSPPSCSLDTTVTPSPLNIVSTRSETLTIVRDDPGVSDAIKVFSGTDPITCANSPTVNNTGTVNITTTGNDDQTVVIDLGNGPFSPGNGATTGVGDIAEIKFDVNLGNGTNDGLKVAGGAANETITFGTAGVALNTDTDPDVTLTTVEARSVQAGGGDDRISGAGGNGSGAVITTAVTLIGDAGNDTIISGKVDDTLTGGDGTDTLDYSSFVGPVNVDLGATTPQGTGANVGT